MLDVRNRIQEDISGTKAWFEFQDYEEFGPPTFLSKDGVTLYEKQVTHNEARYITSCIMPSGNTKNLLENAPSGLHFGLNTTPSFHHFNGSFEYSRFDNSFGLEPLSIVRFCSSPDFIGNRVQLSQDFELLFNLFISKDGLVEIHSEANEPKPVGRMGRKKTVISEKLINLYLNIRDVVLVQFFEVTRYSEEHSKEKSIIRNSDWRHFQNGRCSLFYIENPDANLPGKIFASSGGIAITHPTENYQDYLENLYYGF